MIEEKEKLYDLNKIRSEFPALQIKVWEKPLSYLDSAASMQQPKEVLDSINHK